MFRLGAVDVYLCGKYLTRLDALWDRYDIFKHSYNDVYSFVYDPAEVTDAHGKYCTLNSITSLEFRRVCNPKAPNKLNSEASRQFYLLARGKNKFKIAQIELCESV